MYGLPLILAGLLSFGFCVIIIPILIHLSHKNEWYDDIDHRKIHTGNVPRLAGIGIFISMSAGLLVGMLISIKSGAIGLNIPPQRILIFFIAYLMIHIIGLIDDFKSLNPYIKFVIQIAATLIIMIPGRTFEMIRIPFINVTLDIGFLGYILTGVWIIGVCNAVNLIDGMDGLSGGLSAIAALFTALISISIGSTATAIVAFALFGSILGFLVFNFPPAKIFMGDSGSLFIGFAIATMPLIEMNRITDMSLIIAISLIFIPVLDTLTSMLRRKMRGQSMFFPDREHIHHKLMDKNLSVKQILSVLYIISIILSATVFSWTLCGAGWIINLTIVLWIMVVGFFFLLAKKHTPNS